MPIPPKNLVKKEKLEKLVKKYTYAETIETRNSDRLDFYDMHIGNIVAMVEAAYKMGINDAKDKDKIL